MNRLFGIGVLLAGLSALPLHALQEIDVKPGVTRVVKISAKETTHLRFDGQAVTGITGDVVDEKRNPTGSLNIELTPKGEVFAGLAQPVNKPVNIFLHTANGSYPLLLQPIDIPIETVVLRDPQVASVRPDGTAQRAHSHVRRIKGLMMAMATGQTPPEFSVSAVGTEVGLWQETRFVLQRRYSGPGLVGEQYLLTNRSQKPMVIAEPELYARGVVAVALDQHELPPGAATAVYVVRTGS